MKPGLVIGTVTLSQAAPQFRGARWLIVSPMEAEQLAGGAGHSDQSTPVVYDDLGAGVDTPILYVEGAEATRPFDHPIPLDAINVAILDTHTFNPPSPPPAS